MGKKWSPNKYEEEDFGDNDEDLQPDRRKKKTANQNPLLVPADFILQLFDMSRGTFQKWLKAGCPKHSHGKYDFRAVHQWFLENIYKVGEEDGVLQVSARTEYWQAKAKRETIRANIDEQSVMQREVVEKEWALRLAVLVSGLKNLSNRLPPVLQGKSIIESQEIVKKETKRFQDDLQKPMKILPGMRVVIDREDDGRNDLVSR